MKSYTMTHTYFYRVELRTVSVGDILKKEIAGIAKCEPIDSGEDLEALGKEIFLQYFSEGEYVKVGAGAFFKTLSLI